MITQNVDGLFMKAGIPQSALAELHGNIYTEKCLGCGSQIERNFRTRN